MTRNKLTIIILSILLIAASAALLRTKGTDPFMRTMNIKGSVPFVFHYSTLMGREFFDKAYEQAPEIKKADSRIVGGTVNHHLLAAPLDAQFFEGLMAQKPKRVILIGPDHLSRGKTPITVSAGTWKTPYGDLKTDTALVAELSRRNLAQIEEPPFDHEFSVGGLVPFVKRSLPDAEIITIILRIDAEDAELDALAAALPTDDDTVVIGSIDFSHYLPSRAAEFHDITNRAIIGAFAFDRFDRLEIDSPPTLRTLMKYLERRGAREATLLANTDSAKITGLLDTPETTSYMNQYFSAGEPTPMNVQTSLYIPSGKKIVSNENRFMGGFMTIDDGTTLPAKLKRLDMAVGIVRSEATTTYYLFPFVQDDKNHRLMTAAEEKAYFVKNKLDSAIITELN
jgi:AmmeMemoRadiSam system protein B